MLMSRLWEIVFCVPLLFRCHICLSNLKHAPSRKLPLTARKTVFSHLNDVQNKLEMKLGEVEKSLEVKMEDLEKRVSSAC